MTKRVTRWKESDEVDEDSAITCCRDAQAVRKHLEQAAEKTTT